MNLDLKEMFEQSGAILNGHFKLSSGRHSAVYFEKARILEQPKLLTIVCQTIADAWKDRGITHVIGPTFGGVLVAYETARQLNASALYLERENEKRVLRRGAFIHEGAKILLVDDILTTGKSVFESQDGLNDLGAKAEGVAVMVDRSTHAIDFGVPLTVVWKNPAESFEPDNCPLCEKGIPLVAHGSRFIKK